ncbi:hypothetical protein GQ42DRAFT_112278, partial [Ramicandelaber brevisporus]
HALPVHSSCASSILASDGRPRASYRGFLNLSLLVLFATNLRLILENARNYGWQWIPLASLVPVADVPSATLALAVPLACYLVTFLIEITCGMHATGSLLHFVMVTAPMSFSTVIVYNYIDHPFVGTGVMLATITIFAKQMSFILVCSDSRQHQPHSAPINRHPHLLVHDYQQCLRLSHYLYFLFAPTLSFQASYPRNSKVDFLRLAKSLAELSISSMMMLFLTAQYALPSLRLAFSAIEKGDIVATIECVLLFSTASVLLWLLMFFSMFHAWCNVLGELLQFGDRQFYLAWWNSGTLARYWRLWNIPVHNWLKRHVYLPLLLFTPFWAITTTFFVSAMFHELLLGASMKCFNGLSFLVIMAQVPLIILTDNILPAWIGKDSDVGNVFFWLLFCIVGQPILLTQYYVIW